MLRQGLLLTLLLLTGCAASPHGNTSPPRFFSGPLPDSLVRETRGFRVATEVAVPGFTRFGSAASLAPIYGLLLDVDPRQQTPAQAALALPRVLDAPAVLGGSLQRQLAAHPHWQQQLRSDAQGELRIQVLSVGILAKDVRETRCQPMLVLNVDLVDARGQQRWRSGYASNRLQEHVNYDCRQLERSRSLAQQAMTEAIDEAMAEAIRRMRP